MPCHQEALQRRFISPCCLLFGKRPHLLIFYAFAVYLLHKPEVGIIIIARDDKTPVRRRAEVLDRETFTATLLRCLGPYGGSNVQEPRYNYRNTRHSFRSCAAIRQRPSGRIGQCALKIFARESAGGYAARADEEERLRDHRIFFVVGTKSLALTAVS
jgi:hypothetical protein